MHNLPPPRQFSMLVLITSAITKSTSNLHSQIARFKLSNYTVWQLNTGTNLQVLLQNLAIQPSSLHSCIKTRRLFVAYNTEEAKRNNLVEPAIFGYLSAFGVVKEIVQQFTSSDYKQQNPYNDYWIVEFLEEGDIERCMAKGTIHYFSGVRIHMKKVFSEQDLLRRKRKLAEEAAQAQKNLTESVSFNTKHFRRN
jgi:hypothetical protein